MRAWLRTLHDLLLLEQSHDDHEIVAEGITVWVGDHQIHRRTLNALLWMMAVSETSDVKGLERYAINGIGRALVRRPELADEIGQVISQGGAWTVQDDRLVRLGEVTTSGGAPAEPGTSAARRASE